MKVPFLKKKPEIKSCHNIDWEDNYSWIHQSNILEVLRDKTKLDPEVKKYLEEENSYAEHHLKNTKNLPPIANKIAKIIKPIKSNILNPFDIFFEAILPKCLNKKYKAVKINTV